MLGKLAQTISVSIVSPAIAIKEAKSTAQLLGYRNAPPRQDGL